MDWSNIANQVFSIALISGMITFFIQRITIHSFNAKIEKLRHTLLLKAKEIEHKNAIERNNLQVYIDDLKFKNSIIYTK